VPFSFQQSSPGALRQGELLADLYVHRVAIPAMVANVGDDSPIESSHHPLVLVMHSDCDLLRDFEARQAAVETNTPLEAWGHKATAPHVLLLDVFREGDIRPRAPGSAWQRIVQNETERYHYLRFEPIAGEHAPASPLLLDFRKMVSVYTEDLYRAIDQQGVRRLGIIPPIYLQDVMHRCFGYMSRIGLPDE